MVSLCEMDSSSRRPDNTCDSCSRDDNRGYKHERHPACLMDLRSEAARLHTTYSPNSRQGPRQGASLCPARTRGQDHGRLALCVSPGQLPALRSWPRPTPALRRAISHPFLGVQECQRSEHRVHDLTDAFPRVGVADIDAALTAIGDHVGDAAESPR